MATFPVAIAWPSTNTSGLVFTGGLIAGVAVVLLRDRKKSHRRPRMAGWRRWVRSGLRGTAVLLAGGIMLGSAGIASPAQAHAAWYNPGSWVAGAASGAMSSVVCGLTGPDLTPQPPGTGPETFFSNRNLGKVLNPNGGKNNNTVVEPKMADEATLFSRAHDATDYSMDSYTLYEIAGLRGVKWVNWQYDNEGEQDCAMMPWLSVLIGNQIMQINNYLLQTTIAFKEFANTTGVMHQLSEALAPTVGAMYSKFFVPFGTVMVFVAGISMMVRGLSSSGGRKAIGDAGGTGIVLMMAGVFYGGIGAGGALTGDSGFEVVADTGTRFGTMISAGFAQAVLGTLPNGGADLMCKEPEVADDVGAYGQRYTSCVLAETLAYEPWAVGQFGAAGRDRIAPATDAVSFDDPTDDSGQIEAQDDGSISDMEDSRDDPALGLPLPCYVNYDGCSDMRSYLIAHTGGPSYQQARNDCLDGEDGFARKVSCVPYYAAAEQLYFLADDDADDTGNGTLSVNQARDATVAFHGYGTMPHVLKALSALMGSFFAAIGIAVTSLVTMWWKLMVVVAFLLGPMRLTWAAWPGKLRMAKSWVSDIGYAIGMSTVYGMLVTLMVYLLAVVYTQPLNSGLKLLWSIVVLLGMWKSMRKMEEIAKPEGASNMGAAGVVQGAVGTGAALTMYGGARGLFGAGSAAASKGGEAASTIADRARSSGTDDPSTGGGSTAPGRGGAAAAGVGRRVANSPKVSAARGAVNRAGTAAGDTAKGVGNRAASSKVVSGARLAGRSGQATARAMGLQFGGRFVSDETASQWATEGNKVGVDLSSFNEARMARNAQRKQKQDGTVQATARKNRAANVRSQARASERQGRYTNRNFQSW
ncbi:MAG: hypothetical protein L0H59_00140 [Tomitella sp.]|nr:hypothetical protein [Tomitella sp.]